MARILAIDDDADILILIKSALEKDGHSVTAEPSAERAEKNDLTGFDLILLDVMMPGTDGFAFCRKIRGCVDCPILFLTARTMESDAEYGLGIGADDYIRKPFGVGELRARVNAHLRREGRERKSLLLVSGARFDLAGRELSVGEDRVPLTKSEYAICEFLARSRGRVFSREQIYEGVFGYEGESDASAVAEHVKNIRAKLGAFGLAPIATVWGIGYKWE